MKTTGVVWGIALFAFLAALPPQAAPAQTPDTSPAVIPNAADVSAPPAAAAGNPPMVAEVRIEGIQQMTRNAVLAIIRTREGQPYDETVAKDDQRRLLQSGRFSDVVVMKADTDKGVVVTFAVKERELISTIMFVGNRKFNETDLRKELTFAQGDPLDPNRIEIGRVSIEQKYKDKGYFFVNVTVDKEALENRKQVVYQITEGPQVKVKKIVFQGNAHYADIRLRLIIKSSQAWWPFTIGKFDEETMDRDVVDLRSFYRDEGYLDAEVARKWEFSPDKKNVIITFIIQEGPRYRVNEVTFQGNTIYTDQDLLNRLHMTQGQPYTAQGLKQDTKALEDAFGEIGFINTVATPKMRYMSPTEEPPAWLKVAKDKTMALVNLVYQVDESEQFHVGRITIRGNTVTQDRVIRRQLRFFPEQIYDTVAVEESKNRLTESRLFDDVSITPYGEEPGVRNALVNVKEARTAQFIIGVGYSTNDGVIGTISLGQRNYDASNWPESWDQFIRGQAFKGAGQTMQLTVNPGTEVNSARLDWAEPYLFDKPIALGDAIYFFTRPRESYTESRVGFQTSLGKMFKNRWYAEGAIRVEDVDISSLDSDAPPEVIADKGNHGLLGFKGTLVRDRTDSRWLPSKGDRLTLDYEQVIVDGTTFGKPDIDYIRYFTVFTDELDRKHIVAFRVHGQSIVGDNAPVFEKYYGGGLGDIRGFKYRGISPRSPGTDEPIGGNFHVYAGSEYSYPIYGDILRGVFFVDSGTVEEDYTVTTWRISAGAGIRLTIPFFGPVPMELDFGVPVNKNSQDDTQLVSFSFGAVF